jgi:hypothetical protein
VTAGEQLAQAAVPANLRSAAGARREAARILRGPDFRARETPRPLRGVLQWIGERLEPLGRPFRAVGDRVADDPIVAAVAAVVVVAVAVVAALLLVRRRSLALLEDGGGRRGGRERQTPAELERLAEAAERKGEHEGALRLRFRAGLLRLDEAGALSYRPSMTTGAVTRQVVSPVLEELAATLEEVVYGERLATPEDVATARLRWPEALVEARAR